MKLRWLIGGLVVCLGLVSALVVGHARVSVARPTTGLRLLGAVPSHEMISFELELRLNRPAAMRALVEEIENPKSSRFRHLVTPAAFGAAFGISRPRFSALRTSLEGAGLRAAPLTPQRTALAVSGRAGAVARWLHTRLLVYAGAGGRHFRALGSPVVLPKNLVGTVAAVTGLDTRPQWHPRDVPIGGLTPELTAQAYDIARLHRAGIQGQGQTIAVVSFSAFRPGDPVSFSQHYGLTGPAPQVVPVAGGTTDLSRQKEANLDIDVIRAVAPAARIIVYESAASYGAVLGRIVADHKAQIVSSSWGQCERGLDPGERLADSQELTAAALAGVSTFVATGDNGAYDCQEFSPSDHHLTVDWPAANANAIAVGGTRLYVNPQGAYQTETAWEDQLSLQGGGGGFAASEKRPSWQVGPGVDGVFSNGRRQLPDVSADADPGTAWSYFVGGELRPDGSGTSASAPFWAAAMALIEQYAHAHGIRRVGYVNPTLYAIAASQPRYRPFHDVVEGANRYYPAGRGWDAATGLGTPDVYNLARDIVRYLKTHPRQTGG